ncbi:hypothetical protein E5288_WYG009932 [Bos mutus]|uniref:Uncharacterized protein n=1 Tax=Bos mutus TaxID=72004 RepID=A0A6B0S5N6_9CETA|nr:hypothetical protein [Bos mutus]
MSDEGVETQGFRKSTVQWPQPTRRYWFNSKWVTSHMNVGNEKPFCRGNAADLNELKPRPYQVALEEKASGGKMEELNGMQEDVWGLVLIVPWSKARLDATNKPVARPKSQSDLKGELCSLALSVPFDI